MSSVYKTGPTSSVRLADNNQASTTKYTVYLDLKDAYQGWWLPRTNAYTMRLSLISDTGPATGEILLQPDCAGEHHRPADDH